jgi:transcriptional regulator of acetoin/glycerol metabolism
MKRRMTAIRKPLAFIVPLEEVKRRAMRDALDKCDGHVGLAAKMLGVGKTTIYRFMEDYRTPVEQARALKANG